MWHHRRGIRGKLSEEEQAQLDAWIAESPEHLELAKRLFDPEWLTGEKYANMLTPPNDQYHHILSKDKDMAAEGQEPVEQADKYAIQFLPTKILIDKEGKIVGQFDDDTIEEALAGLLPG